MIPIILGHDLKTGRSLQLSRDVFERHFHLVGSTGSGKTTAVMTMLRPILADPMDQACVFIIDRMGNLSQDILRWMAWKADCPEHVRRRLLYIEPAREDMVLPFNPLLYESQAHQYYQVERAVSIILRAWESQDLASQPRLRKWTFNAFTAAAELQYPLSVCEYLLQPGTEEHACLLEKLPRSVKHEWQEILSARGNEAVRILESTRNRIDPFYKSIILRRMFGSKQSNFDVERFIRERRIVVLNLASYKRLPTHLAGTIGALALNEMIETVLNLPKEVVRPTYILLDEFQNFVGPDIYEAIPTVRQQGARLILAHQSFSQLLQGDIDLSALIWQARSRLMFACDADDADILANEVAHLTYDPHRVKHQILSHRQRIAGYRREWLATHGSTESAGENWSDQSGSRWSTQESYSQALGASGRTRTAGSGADNSQQSGRGRSLARSDQRGEHEVNVPIHEDFCEVSGVTFVDFEQTLHEWGGAIRKLRTGEPLGKFADDPIVYHIGIERHEVPDNPRINDEVQRIVERNFACDVFVPASQIDREAECIRAELLQEPTMRLSARSGMALGSVRQVPKEVSGVISADEMPSQGKNPFMS